jgi:MoxR-like ATPase
MRISMGYPDTEDERQIIRNQRKSHPVDALEKVVDGQELLDLSQEVFDVHVEESLENYILKIVRNTRTHRDLALGSSPRGSLALYKTAQALAALRGRNYVIPDDIKRLAPVVLAHRLILKPESQLRGRSSQVVLEEILTEVEVELGEIA